MPTSALPAITFSKTVPTRADTAILVVGDANTLGPAAGGIDRAAGGLISRHLKGQSKFTGKKGQTLILTLPDGKPYGRYILLGAGDMKAVPETSSLQAVGGKLHGLLTDAGAARVVVFAPDDKAESAAAFAAGIALQAYKFDKYKSADTSKDKKEDAPLTITIVTPAASAAKTAYAALDAGRQGVFLARDLLNEPANVLYPEAFANMVRADLAPLGVKVEILDSRRLEKLGFGAHLAVGWGSTRPSCAVVMRWSGRAVPSTGAPGKAGTKNKKAGKPLAFVGKGVTFDSGGISIKPSAGMDEMKYDMGGAAAVCGLMKSLALRKSSADVIGMIGLAENTTDGAAMRPGDIVTSLSGKTIEILNTDAEGRLVLCDALTYIQRTYDPAFIIDLATLTGAMVVALGSEYAGAFVNDDALWDKLNQAGRQTGEKVWRMPLDEAYRKAMEGAAGDLRNISTLGAAAGSCTAAGYLETFIDAGRPWAHLDIAGVAYKKNTAGGVGWGVQLLDRLVADNYEQ